jgi:hypothetical protein
MRAEIRAKGLKAVFCVIVSALTLFGPPPVLSAGPEAPDVRKLKEEIEHLKSENEANRKKMEDFEKKLEQIESRSEEKQKELTAEISKGPSPGAIRQALGPYWGENRFMIAGYGFVQHSWNRNANTNSFEVGFNPVMLFRLNDWILFQSELEVELPDDAETEVNLEFAEADVFLNDYVTLAAGKYLLPFGDFIERLHPPWINKLVTFPLPFRSGHHGGLLPFADVGLQARGGVPLGMLGDGARFEYTIYGGNGAQYQSDAVGSSFGDPNVDINRGKSIGARVAFLPLPIDAGAGQLEIGASTYNAQWNPNGNWVHAAGVHTAYQFGDAELRGEYLQVRRNMPDAADLPPDEGGLPVDAVRLPHDNREGWYIQGAYSLAKTAVPHLDRTELVARYSREDQRATEEDSGPHPRQVALGVDYWLTPSVVFKLEYDRDMPRDAKDNNQVLTQFALGF